MEFSLQTSYKKGLTAEDVAADYLIELGHQIIERRFNTIYGEIDIISLSRLNSLYIIEVRSRELLKNAINSISKNKLRKIFLSTQVFLSRNISYNKYDIYFALLSLSLTKDNEIKRIDIININDSISDIVNYYGENITA